MRNAFVESLFFEAKKNPDIVLITGDLGFQLFESFKSEIPNQFINAGLTEQSMMTMAAGMASTGKRVFVYSIANFSTFRCLEQIRNDVSYMGASVVVVSVGAGYAYGALGYSHHALEDLAIMRSLPNMQIVSPADRHEVNAIIPMLAQSNEPCYLRIGKANEADVHDQTPSVKWGRFVQIRDGSYGFVFFTGSVGKLVVEASDFLRDEGKLISVYSVPFVSLLDMSVLESVPDYAKVVVVEEHFARGGLTTALLEAFNHLGKFINVSSVSSTLQDLSLTGSQEFLREKNGISLEKIIQHFS